MSENTATTIQPTQETPTQEQDPKDEEKKDGEIQYADIHDASLEDLAREATAAPTEEAKPTEETKPKDEEKKEEIKPTEEAKPTELEEPPQPALDPEKLKQELTQSVAQEVVKSLTDKGNTKEDKDEMEELMKTAPWVKENRNPTYAEVIKWTVASTTPMIKKQVIEELNKEVEEEDKKEQAAKQQQEQERKTYNQYWDSQMSDLEKAGKLTPVKGTDLKDPGRKERYDLYQKMIEVNTQRTAQGQPIITNLKEVYYEHYEPAKTKVDPGRTAPVAGAKKGMGQSDERKEFTYQDIHNADLGDILREQAGQ